MSETQTYSYRLMKFGEPLVLSAKAVAQPDGRAVLLRTRRCGVCHSDLHLAEGYYDLGGGKRLELADRNIKPPLIMGHEIVGELVAAGPDADLSGLTYGTSYLVLPWIGCGACPNCLRGKENLCLSSGAIGVVRDGGYGDYVLVPDARYLLDIEGLDLAAAATLACAGLTAYSAIKKIEAGKEDWLALLGMGGLGTAALLIARALGYENIIGIDLDDKKLEMALAQGAKAVFNARDPALSAKLQALTGGIMSSIDFVGSQASASMGIGLLARGGKFVIVGLFGGDITLSLPTLPIRAITISGSYVGNLDELKELVALAKSGKIGDIPTQLIRPDQINAAHDLLRSGQAHARQVIAYD